MIRHTKRICHSFFAQKELSTWNVLKNHFRNLQAPLCGIFYPHSVAVARYAALIRIKSPTNWDSQLTKSLFQTRSIPAMPDLAQVEKRLGDKKWN